MNLVLSFSIILPVKINVAVVVVVVVNVVVLWVNVVLTDTVLVQTYLSKNLSGNIKISGHFIG